MAVTFFLDVLILHSSFEDGVAQKPIEGNGKTHTSDDAGAADCRTTQHFEMLGNHGIDHDGWMASTIRGVP